MTNDVLIVSEDQDTVIIAFENSDGDIEYTEYTVCDGGIIIDPPDSDISAIIASDNGITEYQDYELKEIT